MGPRQHGALDYLLIVSLLLAPPLLGLDETPMLVAYAAAILHGSLTLLTAFPMGLADVIPFRVHAGFEVLGAVALVASPWLFGFAADERARSFFVAAGLVLAAAWALTMFRTSPRPRASAYPGGRTEPTFPPRSEPFARR